MLNRRDCIYYNWLFDKIKPKNIWWLLYCKIRRFITVTESPSKVAIWDWREFCGLVDKALKEKRY